MFFSIFKDSFSVFRFLCFLLNFVSTLALSFCIKLSNTSHKPVLYLFTILYIIDSLNYFKVTQNSFVKYESIESSTFSSFFFTSFCSKSVKNNFKDGIRNNAV